MGQAAKWFLVNKKMLQLNEEIQMEPRLLTKRQFNTTSNQRQQ